MTPSYKIASALSEKIYQFIADKKTLPWRSGFISYTENPITGTKYKGINFFLTQMHLEEHGLKVPKFMTFTQIKNLGGMVKKGEHSVPVIYYKSYVRSGKDMDIDQKNELVSDNALHIMGHKSVLRELRPSYFLRTYNVYGVESTNLPVESYDPKLERAPETVHHEKLLKIIEDYCLREHIEITYSGIRAWYDAGLDRVNIPRIENFDTLEKFYHTLSHEIIHSSGHRDRTGRFQTSKDLETSRRDQYAFEELVADIGATILLSQVGLVPDIPNSASYIEGWLSHWSDKKDQIYKAMKQAEKACSYITNTNLWGNNERITNKV